MWFGNVGGLRFLQDACSESRGLKGGVGGAETHAGMVEGEAAVHAFMDFDPGPGVACPAV